MSIHPDSIVISKVDYDALVQAARFLDALRAAGIDNWEGFDQVIEEFEDA